MYNGVSGGSGSVEVDSKGSRFAFKLGKKLTGRFAEMERRVFMGKGWLGIVLSLILCFALVFSLGGAVGTGSALADEEGLTYAIMHPDKETREKWIEAYNSAPLAYIEREGFQIPSPRGSQDLLGHLKYTPSERDQGNCGNCWAWAGTGCLGIALDVQEGVKDRLSVQYINSCETAVIGKACCQGGWLYEFADFYDPSGGKGKCIPWSNTSAYWQDGDASCDTPCGSISESPNYAITSINEATITTQTVNQATAIANIKNVLDQDRAVWFGFFLPTAAAWSDFQSFWNTSGESVVYNMDKFCGVPDEDAGGHAVLCVGYNDDNPGNSYWIMLNSWGTTSNRPNGLFRIDMDMNYDGQNPGLGGGDYSFYWQTLDVTFWSLPDITVDPTSFEVTLCPDTSWDDTLTIGNDGDADLGYDISDYETTGFTAPTGVEAPDLPGREPLELIELNPAEPVSFAALPPLRGAAEELAYDDNEADTAWGWVDAGGEFAVRFTPPSYPVSLETARICLSDSWPDSDHEQFAVKVYDDDGAGGEPGTCLGSVNTTATDWGWWDVDISGLGIAITGGDFYLAYKQLGDSPDYEGLCADTTAPDGRSWAWNLAAWSRVENTLIGPVDWMIRCVVEETDCGWLSQSPAWGTIAPGNDVDITVGIDTSGLAVGDYSAEIYVSNNDPDENPKMVPVTLHVVLMPDLVITEKYEEWVSFAGKTYNITYTVKNQGSLAAGASKTRIYIDSGSYDEYYDCPALDPGASYSNTVGPYIMSGDSDSILVYADPYTAVAESNEDNNWQTNTIVLLPGDANGDGVLNAVDITTVEMIVGGVLPPTPGADANEDGEYNAVDITTTEMLVGGVL